MRYPIRYTASIPGGSLRNQLAAYSLADLHALIGNHGDDEGPRRFLGNCPDDGSIPPDTLRLADYNLGHDARAQTPQRVTARLGPRFRNFQLAQSAGESWAECRMHADNIQRIRRSGCTLTRDDAIESSSTAGKRNRAKNNADDFFGHNA